MLVFRLKTRQESSLGGSGEPHRCPVEVVVGVVGQRGT